MNEDTLLVRVDDRTLFDEEVLVGTIHRARAHGNEAISFAYDPKYLARSDRVELDPSLPLYAGRQYAPDGGLFGAFRDCSPDRWGRVLMERREANEAETQARDRRRLTEWDFLIGVSDTTRHGAVRLQRPDPPYAYVDEREVTVPPVTSLRELEALAQRVEDGRPVDRDEEERWLAQLVAPGSSLGGARPKATFREVDGSLWVAKFPSTEDRYDQGAWEVMTSILARAAGIEMSETKAVKLGSRYRTFVSRRFDRVAQARRLYASAMTLLGAHDGASASYLELAEAIQDVGDVQQIDDQLSRLYRRIVFSILVANRDDHLRNHGFFRTRSGWILSPAFDINPNPDKSEHALAIDETSPSPSVRRLRSTREYYRLTDAKAEAVEQEVRAAVKTWPDVATRLRISRDEQSRLSALLDPERT